ncbi:MAG: glutathione S-transferase family protein [Pseudohongiellaceae bacterium]
MIFYYTPGTCALASHLALEHAGAEYEARMVDFSREEQKSGDYRRINPKARVPALVTDRGVLTETPAILAYVSQIFPEAKLAPVADPFEFAQVQAFNSYLCSTVHVAHAHKFRGSRWVDDDAAIEAMKKKVPQTVRECFELIEAEMIRGPWVMGDAYTVCDMYLFTLAQWLEGDGVDITRLETIADHRERMYNEPVVKRVLDSEQAARLEAGVK